MTKTLAELGVDPRLADLLADQDIDEAFPIQELAIPMALKGADVIGQARTGTGKTLAFGLPLLQRIDPDLERTQALVVTPTRELAIQVAGDLEIGRELDVDIQLVYGGVGYEEQIAALTSGVNVVVGTPGRLLDHLGRGNLDLSGLSELVLDEADEMLDMGFLPDVERLIEATPDDRHTMLFSATVPAEIVKLARRYMSHPTFLRTEAQEHEVAPTVDQHFFLVHRMDKPRILARILQDPDRGGAYVFTRTKRMADRLVGELDDMGVSAIAVHGDKRQATRERNMDKFRDGSADVLVATEVAARGLDVDNVTHVINYDCPDDEKMYVHRIGRTARAGNDGVAVTFAEHNQVDRVNVIRRAVETEEDVVEVFSTSDELTDRFNLPTGTPWQHLGGNGSGNGSSRSRGSSRPKAKASRSPSRSSSRSSSSSPGRKPSGGARPSSQRPRNRPGDDERSTGSSAQPQLVRTRTRGGGTSARADETNQASHRAGDDGQPTRSRKRDRGGPGSEAASAGAPVRSRTRSRTPDTDDTGAGTDGAEAGGSNGSGRRPTRTTFERTTTEPIVRTAAGEQAQGEGRPRLARPLEVEHLP